MDLSINGFENQRLADVLGTELSAKVDAFNIVYQELDFGSVSTLLSDLSNV
ncbi:MAG: hypothetical protein IPQ02_09740 [Saprospiraceae bacterium]|nr:hypothetical protein [Candidatus Defluviibacterium haderslevense]